MEALLAAPCPASGRATTFFFTSRARGDHFLRAVGVSPPGQVKPFVMGPWPITPSSGSPRNRSRIAAAEAGFKSDADVKEEVANDQTETASEEEESKEEAVDYAQREETDGRVTAHVRVKFSLQQSCEFGEQFLLAGDDPGLGSWSPDAAIPLEWSDGNIWTGETDLPAGKEIKFKFILQEQSGGVRWQPGRDRVLLTWDTTNTIAATYDWVEAEALEISEVVAASPLTTDPQAILKVTSQSEQDAGDTMISSASSDDDDDADVDGDNDKGTEEVFVKGTRTEDLAADEEKEEEKGEEERVGSGGNILENDMRWGREALDKILSRLGFFHREESV